MVRRFHARGGLGEVYAATDTELNREVAFKRIQPQLADHPRNRRRFVTEAGLTARLDHPGVVPVYGLVTDPDGRPCYAMRFVRGETLSDQIAAFHAAPESAGGRDLSFRQLLQKFTAICNAIGFAHSKGVIHRDLKPANVMVGAFGEVQVMDWGLAKEFRSDHVASAPDSATPTGTGEGLSGTHDRGGDGTEDDKGTQAGAVVGTPAYMAPEQAAGSRDVGPAADIYSLGATLYQILTGLTAFSGSGDLKALLDRIRRGDFPRPRQLSPRVHKALEAICLKAMALRPEDRYATATDLAADVDRWLSDEPVSCYREPLRQRVARWGRRHRVLVNSAATGVMLAVVALTYTTIRVNDALASETAQRQEADKRFDQAFETVNKYLLTVADDPQLQTDDLQPLRRSLLGDAQAYYADFLLKQPDDPRLRAKTAAAHLRLARASQELGDSARARQEYEEGISGYHTLLTENPEEVGWKTDLARGYVTRGDFQMSGNGTRAEALESYTEALALLEPLAADPAAWEALARAYTSLGRWHKGERSGEAANYAQRAVAIHRNRWNAASADPYPRRDLAQSLIDLATLHNEARRLQLAKANYDESLGHWQAVSASGAFGFAPKAAEGRILHDLAIVHEQLLDADQAAESRAQALKIRESTAYGHGLQFFTDLARTYNDLGLQLFGQGGAKKFEGLRLVDEGRRIREKLATLTQATRERLMLVESYSNQAYLAIQEQAFDKAAEALKLGQAILAQLPPDQAKTIEALRAKGLNYHNEGALYSKQENWALAKKSLESAHQARLELIRLNPDSSQDLSDLAATYVMLGNVTLPSDAKKAIAWYAEASKVSRELFRLSPESLSAKMLHGIIVYSLANAKHRSGAKSDEVAALLVEASDTTRSVHQAAPKLPQPRMVLGVQLGLLLQTRAAQGQTSAAVETAKSLAVLNEAEPAKLVELARSLVVLAKNVPQGPNREAAVNAYSAQSVIALEGAVKAGFKNADVLRKDPFIGLAGRADYEALIRRMSGKDK